MTELGFTSRVLAKTWGSTGLVKTVGREKGTG